MDIIEPASPRTARDTVRYIESLAKELRALAVESRLGFLAYLLSMVEADAADTAKRLTDKQASD